MKRSALALMLVFTLSPELLQAACKVMVRPTYNNELTRVSRAGNFSFPNYRRYSAIKVRTGMTESTDFLAFNVSLADANSAAQTGSTSSCAIDPAPKCQVMLEAPNKVKIQQRVLVNKGGDVYEEEMRDAISIQGTARTSLNSNIDQFRNGQHNLNCEWESGRATCTIERTFNSSTSEMKYKVKIGGTVATGLNNLSYAAAVEAMNNLGQGAMDFSGDDDEGDGAGPGSAPSVRGPTLCTINEIPTSLACSIDSSGGGFRVVYGTVGGRRFPSQEAACSDLQGRVSAGECYVEGSHDPCAGVAGADGPRDPSHDAVPGVVAPATGGGSTGGGGSRR